MINEFFMSMRQIPTVPLFFPTGINLRVSCQPQLVKYLHPPPLPLHPLGHFPPLLLPSGAFEHCPLHVHRFYHVLDKMLDVSEGVDDGFAHGTLA
ncbi:hypothetical protein HJC23_009715 [Cyclotella cryptica]|uniref:Uncharacterized protein n=1 Tax=Cyclotella cryptica TaxID=29204 RepID=A0ABD3Q7V5_9STRA